MDTREHKSPLPTMTVILCGLGALLIVLFNLSYPGHYHFSLLAKSFIEGKAYLIEGLYGSSVGDVFMHDASFYRGRFYWPLGPLPAVLLMPFAFVDWNITAPTPEGLLNLVAVCGGVSSLIRILSHWFTHFRDRLIGTLAFFMGSPMLAVAMMPKSWFVAQTLTVTLLLIALHEYLTKRRYGYLGLLFGLILGTRITAWLGILFFIIMLIRENRNALTILTKKFFLLLAPSLVVMIGLAAYNSARFDTPLEQGYRYQLVAHQLENQRAIGLFSLQHVPTNIYYLLLAPPKPAVLTLADGTIRIPIPRADPWGMSIFLTSPFLLFLFLKKPSVRMTKTLLVTSAVVLLPILLYYGIGFHQFGYRYLLDCFPFLFLAFIVEYRNHRSVFSRFMTTLITCSAALNLFFFMTLLCTKLFCEQ